MSFLGGPEEGVPTGTLDHLKPAPEKLKARLHEVASSGMIQALAIFKSHYPRVDLQWLKEGFTADVDDNKFDSLVSNVRSTANLVVENLELEYL